MKPLPKNKPKTDSMEEAKNMTKQGWEKDLEKLVEYLFLKAGYWIITYKGCKKDSKEVKVLKTFIKSVISQELSTFAKEVKQNEKLILKANKTTLKDIGLYWELVAEFNEAIIKLKKERGIK